jgi:hypothetical protein
MKVVNIPSTKMMKKFLRICAGSSLHRLRVPIHAIVLNVLSSLRASGSRECAPDDRLGEAIHRAA